MADDVRDVSLDQLVDIELGGAAGGKPDADAQFKLDTLRGEIDQIKLDRDAKRAERDGILNNIQHRARVEAELRDLSHKYNDKVEQLTAAKDKRTDARRSHELERRRARIAVLDRAEIICSTLSGAGQESLGQLAFEFETVIVDEAAQSVELASLIPLRYGCRRCIFVGDPNQLPPTVLSRPAMQAGYDQSLFVRMQAATPDNVHLLSIQYRMHPSCVR